MLYVNNKEPCLLQMMLYVPLSLDWRWCQEIAIILHRSGFNFIRFIFIVRANICDTSIADQTIYHFANHKRPEYNQNIQTQHQDQDDVLYKVREPESIHRVQFELRHVYFWFCVG